MTATLALFLAILFPSEILEKHFGSAPIGVVLIAPETGETVHYHKELCADPLPPCSTFKIWNTAIGLETGVLKEANEPFYVWKGEKHWLETWNRNLTLKEAFAVSSVPAYQELARKIGPERMNDWIAKLGYGNGDTASGNDVFWLPSEGRKSILISADEQAALLVKLLQGQLPLSEQTVKVLREVMQMRKTERGTLYGKTGTGRGHGESPAVGWFVGFVESTKGTFVFAVVTRQEATPKGKPLKMLGPEMRDRMIELLEQQEIL